MSPMLGPAGGGVIAAPLLGSPAIVHPSLPGSVQYPMVTPPRGREAFGRMRQDSPKCDETIFVIFVGGFRITSGGEWALSDEML
jgi:hypothetical protein